MVRRLSSVSAVQAESKAALSAQKSAEAIVGDTPKGRINRNPEYFRERREEPMNAENAEGGRPCEDSAEREGSTGAHRSFNLIWKERDSAEPGLLEKVLERGNMNEAFRRVRANRGAPGVDGRPRTRPCRTSRSTARS